MLCAYFYFGGCPVLVSHDILFVNDIWNKSYMNRRNEVKIKKWSLQWTQFMQLRKGAWKKNQDFNTVWTRDLAIDLLLTSGAS